MPDPDEQRAIPFRVSEEDAQARVIRHFSGWLSPMNFLEPNKLTMWKELVPFYAFDARFSAIVDCEWTETRQNTK
jgi:hypothetical protein